MKKSIFVLLLFISFLSIKGQSNYQIVYMADPETIVRPQFSNWLTNIQQKWSATGINLVIKWYKTHDVANYWDTVRTAMQRISAAGLDIYIRISMSRLPSVDTTNLVADYYQFHQDGGYYLNPYHPTEKMFNYTYTGSKTIMTNFVQDVVNFLNSSQITDETRTRILAIIPTLTADDESEYTTHSSLNGTALSDTVRSEECSGYSIPELDAFRIFLQGRYGGLISNLNAKWCPSSPDPTPFSDFNGIITGMKAISSSNWNWQSPISKQIHDYVIVKYPAGRKDWLDFKTNELRKLLKSFADIIRINKIINGTPSIEKYKFGLQFSGFTGNVIERAGRYDPVPILDYMQDKLDLFIEDNTPRGRPGFEFVSNLMRSIAKYLSYRQNRFSNPVAFGTETNWLDFDREKVTPPPYWADSLASAWNAQVSASHDFGGSTMFISHWGTEEFPLVRNMITGDTALPRYAKWQTDLQGYRNFTLNSIFSNTFNPNNEAAHISFLQGLYRRRGGDFVRNTNIYSNLNIHTETYDFPDYEYDYNYGERVDINLAYILTSIYPLEKFYYPSDEYKTNTVYQYYSYSNKKQLLKADILTDYMCENPSCNGSPLYYIQMHGAIFWTAASYYLSQNAYSNLKNPSITNYFENATFNPAQNKYMITAGVKDEYNLPRSILPKQSSKNHINNQIPTELRLSQNYPNPFNPVTTIKYSVPSFDKITLKVFDVLGREVSILVNEFKQPGNYSVNFDGNKLSSGVYMYTIYSSRQQVSKKLILIK